MNAINRRIELLHMPKILAKIAPPKISPSTPHSTQYTHPSDPIHTVHSIHSFELKSIALEGAAPRRASIYN